MLVDDNFIGRVEIYLKAGYCVTETERLVNDQIYTALDTINQNRLKLARARRIRVGHDCSADECMTTIEMNQAIEDHRREMKEEKELDDWAMNKIRRAYGVD